MKYIVETTGLFDKWHRSLSDLRAKMAVVRRLEQTENGNFGDHKAVGNGISEMRIHIGAVYRLYYTIRNLQVVFLLCGGNKSTQQADIKPAVAHEKEL